MKKLLNIFSYLSISSCLLLISETKLTLNQIFTVEKPLTITQAQEATKAVVPQLVQTNPSNTKISKTNEQINNYISYITNNKLLITRITSNTSLNSTNKTRVNTFQD